MNATFLEVGISSFILKLGKWQIMIYNIKRVSTISVRNTEIPQNPAFEGFPIYLDPFPNIFN